MSSLRVKRTLSVALFLVLLVIVEQVVAYFVLPMTNYGMAAQRDRARYEGDITALFLGSSLFVDGLIPEVIDERITGTSFNLATNAQSMRLSYYALMDVIERNALERCVIEVSISRMQRDVINESGLAQLAFYDYLMTGGSKALYIKENYTFDDVPSIALLSKRCQLKFASKNLINKLKPESIMGYIKDGYINDLDGSSQYGDRGYIVYHKRLLQGRAGVETVKAELAPEDTVPVGAEWDNNVVELQRLIELCQEKGIEVVLVSAPNTAAYFMNYHTTYQQTHDEFQQIADIYGVEFYDFNYSKRMIKELDDTHFKDIKHMNHFGAEIFTSYLAEVLAGEFDEADFLADYEVAIECINRVAAVGLKVKDGVATVESIQPPGTVAEYRFLMKPYDGDDYVVLRDYSEDASFDYSNYYDGHSYLIVEARLKGGEGERVDASARVELK